MPERTIQITELILRDAHQSLMATRMALEDMVPACEELDKAGFWSIECWGGATFDACIRFLNEDPWERLRTFRKLMPNSRLQMLLRGQNLLGYRHYEDEVVRALCGEGRRERHGRVPRFRRAQRHPQSANVAQSRARHRQTRPGHHLLHDQPAAHHSGLRRRWPSSSWTWAAIPSASRTWPALLKPQPAYDLVKGIKTACGEDTLVHVHVHATTGVTLVSLMKAIEAGCDIVDTAISSLKPGPRPQPDREPWSRCWRAPAIDTAARHGPLRRSRTTSPRSGRATPNS